MDAACASESRLTPDAAEFVRYCYRRRGVGWPELYDEMCAVASRGLFRGWGPDELARNGIGFGLFELPALAGLVARVVAEEPAPGRDRCRRGTRSTAASRPLDIPEPETSRSSEGALREGPAAVLQQRFAPAAS